ncbi:MAG: hypothetical protein ACJATN_000436 [Neolewinella sp.]
MVEAGATGIYTKRGRGGGTYAHIDWAINFSNWMSPEFYVLVIEAFRKWNDMLVGRNELHRMFTRELAAKNYGLITGEKRRRPKSLLPDIDRKTKEVIKGVGDQVLLERLQDQMEADILNLALWNMTALQWRSQYPQLDSRKNMRDYACSVELQALSSLQVVMRELQDQQFTQEEKLHHLREKAKLFLDHYADTDDKQHLLEQTIEKRGW